MDADSSVNSTHAAKVCNIAAYKFVRLTHLAQWRARLTSLCQARALKGTVLLSHEGINVFLSGSEGSTHDFLEALRRAPEFHDLESKVSFSDHQPFRRLLIKTKREIIAFDGGRLDPTASPTPKLDALTLKSWLDQGRPVTLLDVRNDYEIRLGAFQNATSMGIQNFRQFPTRVRELSDRLKDRPIVMYCTGGIRCEKAGPYLQQAGFGEVYQLDGGILKYFEQCGDDHFNGECFVFDHRVALDGSLRETPTALCFACQEPLTVEEQDSPHYVPGESCPHCYISPCEALQRQLEKRNRQIRDVSEPLPGSVPYENRRPMHVDAKRHGWTLIDFVTDLHPQVMADEWRRIIDAGRIERRAVKLVAQDRLQAGERIEHLLPNTIEPDVDARVSVLYEDPAIVVVNKPAPLPMHPCGRFNRNTLIFLLNEVYRPQKLHIIHRLDANTTGTVLLARTRSVAADLRPQFVRGNVDKRYLVRVARRPLKDRFTVDLAIGDKPKGGGAREIDRTGRVARTEFIALRQFEDGTTLLEARPTTGRTNQIRLHLAHAGLPVCGDPLYPKREDHHRAATLTLTDPPLCLHAWKISFLHPVNNKRLCFWAKPPQWAALS